MKKYMYLLAFLFFTSVLKGQTLLINKTDSNYVINEISVSSKDKVCRIINSLSKEYIDFNHHSIRPFILIKNFNFTKQVSLTEKPYNSISLQDYVKTTALPKLDADLVLRIDNLESIFHGSNINRIDSLIIFDGKTYWLQPGVVLIEFFNLRDFDQKNVLQANQTIFNTKAKVPQINIWSKDSLPIPSVGGMMRGKIFLLKKIGEEYTFFRHPFIQADAPLTFYNEYVYRKEYGVIAFKSKYLTYNPPKPTQHIPGQVIESNEYYYFK